MAAIDARFGFNEVDLRQDVRQQVVRAADSGYRGDLAGWWSRLATSEYGIDMCFCTEQRCYVVMQRRRRSQTYERFLTPRNMEVLRRILVGDTQKSIASELELAPSTVSLIASRCLQALGLNCCIAKVPLMMVVSAHADSVRVGDLDPRQAEVGIGHNASVVLSFCRPDGQLLRDLSSSRAAVARLRVEGLTHREIADLRGTSPRTVANQLSVTFRQLGVSGRIELLRRLIRSDNVPSVRSSFIRERQPLSSRLGFEGPRTPCIMESEPPSYSLA